MRTRQFFYFFYVKKTFGGKCFTIPWHWVFVDLRQPRFWTRGRTTREGGKGKVWEKKSESCINVKERRGKKGKACKLGGIFLMCCKTTMIFLALVEAALSLVFWASGFGLLRMSNKALPLLWAREGGGHECRKGWTCRLVGVFPYPNALRCAAREGWRGGEVDRLRIWIASVPMHASQDLGVAMVTLCLAEL